MDNIKIVKGNKSWIESNAINQLIKTAELDGIIQAVGLPDLHAGKTPVGAAYMCKDIIYPHIIGNDIGCGFSLFQTDLKQNKYNEKKIIKKLTKLETSASNITELIELDVPSIYKNKLGTIGSGNHFAELQCVDTVYDEDMLADMGIHKSRLLLLVHSGSRSYGEHILTKYLKEHECQNGIGIDSSLFNQYILDHNKAIEFSKLNRKLIAENIMKALNLDYNQVFDSIHNSITPKTTSDGCYYIHRKGASPSDQGYTIVAGSRGTKSYNVKPKDNLMDYCYSIAHGAGRKWSRQGCKERLINIYGKKATKSGYSLDTLIYANKNLIYEEAPEAYKNIERVISDMLDYDLIDLVASVQPLVTYKV